MLRFLSTRILASFLLLFFVLTLTFFILHLAPGEPTDLLFSEGLPESSRLALRELWGLDQPLMSQYFRWLKSFLSGEWGSSYHQHRPVAHMIRESLPASLTLALAATTIQLSLGLTLGFLGLRFRYGDNLLRTLALVFYSLPGFWLGLMAILLFGLIFPIFPIGHFQDSSTAPGWPLFWNRLHHLILPSLVLGLGQCALFLRLIRVRLREAQRQDWNLGARSVGVPESRILLQNLRWAASPAVQVLGLTLPALISGALVIEVVFSWPGMGRLAHFALLQRDYPVVLGVTAFSGCLVIVGNLGADLLSAFLDPRVRDVD